MANGTIVLFAAWKGPAEAQRDQ